MVGISTPELVADTMGPQIHVYKAVAEWYIEAGISILVHFVLLNQIAKDPNNMQQSRSVRSAAAECYGAFTATRQRFRAG